MTPAAPVATGDGLAVVVGNSLPPTAFPDAVERVVAVEGGDPVALWSWESLTVLFRHQGGRPAHRVDHHRHVRALCEAGVGRVLALASAGSLRADWPVGTAVAVDDFLAPWVTPSFHDGFAGHSVPGFDQSLRRAVVDAWPQEVLALVDGGTYAQTTGPRFETPAEVRMLAAFADVVGMTLVGECVLAREAGLRYAAVAMVDNLANGLDAGPLSLDAYRRAKEANEAALAEAVLRVVRTMDAAR